MKRLQLELKTGENLLFLDCVYSPACTTDKTRSLGKANMQFWQSTESGLTGLRGRAYKSMAHVMQSTTRAQPDPFPEFRGWGQATPDYLWGSMFYSQYVGGVGLVVTMATRGSS